ncbi:MAG: GNAT family N-acetyltransferase [Notoacmeibacter sp.]|nr:GNAT family N-acetyltransferase [Notoacmeibacter sp.]MCC0031796.1 GNAT family N-acetyltransferase [Brucellaceae bacterium]
MSGEPVTVRITRLETRRPPAGRHAPPPGLRLSLERATQVSPAFYHFLHDEVGGPHHWQTHRNLDGSAITALFGSGGTAQLHVLSVEGKPSGFFEIDLTGLPDLAEISHFGLMACAQGHGLGLWFLREALDVAFGLGAKRIAVETNTLDHPRAQRLYQRAGFTPVSWREAQVVLGE